MRIFTFLREKHKAKNKKNSEATMRIFKEEKHKINFLAEINLNKFIMGPKETIH